MARGCGSGWRLDGGTVSPLANHPMIMKLRHFQN
jgi:hypothetical protein